MSASHFHQAFGVALEHLGYGPDQNELSSEDWASLILYFPDNGMNLQMFVSMVKEGIKLLVEKEQQEFADSLLNGDEE